MLPLYFNGNTILHIQNSTCSTHESSILSVWSLKTAKLSLLINTKVYPTSQQQQRQLANSATLKFTDGCCYHVSPRWTEVFRIIFSDTTSRGKVIQVFTLKSRNTSLQNTPVKVKFLHSNCTEEKFYWQNFLKIWQSGCFIVMYYTI